MSLAIGLGIGVSFGSGGTDWAAYWATRSPSGLSAINTGTDSEIDLAWTNNGIADYDGIKIYISTDNVTYTLKDTIATLTAYTATGLTAGTLYYFKVAAYKDTNISGYSNVVTLGISTRMVGFVAGWKFNEASGDAADVKGVYTLTNNNTATYEAAVMDNGVSLGTSNTNKSLSIDSALGMTYASARSITGRFKILTAPANGVSYSLVSLMFASNPGSYTAITYRQNANVNELVGRGLVVYATTLTTNQWYHIAITWDQAGNVSKVYLDGVLRITDVCLTGDYSAQTNRLAVGKLLTVNFASSVTDELHVWNKVLTPEEVLEDYGESNYPFIKNGAILNSAAYCWFNSPKAIYNTAANKTWAGIVRNDGTGYSQHILTVDNTTGAATSVRVGSVVEFDDHNEASVLVRSSDNKLFIAYSEHSDPNGLLIRHRISTNPLDASAWGAEVTEDPSGASTYTYCNAFEVVNGDIYIFYRETGGGDAWWNFIKSTDGGATFGDDTRFVHRDYLRCWQNPVDKDIIHFAASHHPNGLTDPNHVFHFYFRSRNMA
jgi:hypothetical protein